jgi:hypothetical protein
VVVVGEFANARCVYLDLGQLRDAEAGAMRAAHHVVQREPRAWSAQWSAAGRRALPSVAAAHRGALTQPSHLSHHTAGAAGATHRRPLRAVAGARWRWCRREVVSRRRTPQILHTCQLRRGAARSSCPRRASSPRLASGSSALAFTGAFARSRRGRCGARGCAAAVVAFSSARQEVPVAGDAHLRCGETGRNAARY